MLLAAFDFLQMKVVDILDILLLGIIIFLAFRWLKGSSAMSIFVAIVSLYIIRVIVGAFDMRLMTAIMDMILDVGVLAIIVIFQPEIRKFLIKLGNRYMNNAQGRAILDKLLGFQQVGVTLTESGAMRPHASVSGLMLSHPAARYFTVGTIGKDQFLDYAIRRGMDAEELARYLTM